MKRTFFRHLTSMFAIAAAAMWTVSADIPAGYYTPLTGKTGADLKTAVYNLVRNFTEVSSYSALPSYFMQTDVYPESHRWWDMYSDIPLYAPSFKGLNREHSFPKSWWGGSTDVPAYVDLNHLYPSEAAANMAKSNYPLGEVSTSIAPKFDNGITTVGYPVAGQGGGAGFVFEPADEYKGDFARTYFYMATTYQDLTWKYTYMVSQNTYPTLNTWSLNLLLKWHHADPVSEKETLRNEAVYKIQNNRNPFIDFPELADYIWGSKNGMPFDPANGSAPAGDPNLITPVQDKALDFGEVAVGKSVTSRLWFNGEYLNSPIELTVYTGDRTLFTIPTRTIAQNLVNSADGYWLNVTYTPTEVGEHSSRLLVSGGGVPGSRGISLIGRCLPVPELSAPVATEPQNITADSYLATWIPAEGEVVDYYIVNRTVYRNGSAMTEKLQAEENSLLIEGFDGSDSEAYTVSSVRLGYVSPESNVVFVDHSGISGVMNDQPMAVYSIPGGFRFVVSAPVTGVRIVDTTGRTVMVIDSVENNTEITTLPVGIYFITSDRTKYPVKVVVR